MANGVCSVAPMYPFATPRVSTGIPGIGRCIGRCIGTVAARSERERWWSDESCARRHTGDDDGAEEAASEHSEDTLPPLNEFSDLYSCLQSGKWTHGEAEDDERGHGGPGTRVQQVTT
jgi:hypothetical protein